MMAAGRVGTGNEFSAWEGLRRPLRFSSRNSPSELAEVHKSSTAF